MRNPHEHKKTISTTKWIVIEIVEKVIKFATSCGKSKRHSCLESGLYLSIQIPSENYVDYVLIKGLAKNLQPVAHSSPNVN